MNADETVVKKKGRGRPKKSEQQSEKPAEVEKDPVVPQHYARKKEAEYQENKKKKDSVIEKFYRIVSAPQGSKLVLVRKKKSGNEYRTYIGSLKKREVQEYVESLKKDGHKIVEG